VNTPRGKATIQTESTVAVDAATYHHGTAAGVNLARPIGEQSRYSAGIRLRVKFFLGELLGLLFIALSTAYIFVIPARLVKRGEVRSLMFRAAKRTIDIFGALAGLLLTLPFWIIIPILMRLDSKGPVFYTQVRVGVNRRVRNRRYYQRAQTGEHRVGDRRREDHLGRPFKVIKFRTMIANAEKVSGPVWATKNDPRITRLGAILRKTRLDEVPQFLNILKGDMSLVGPRPERPVFVRDLSGKVDNYTHRLRVKPGLTGLAQIENGYDSSLTSVVDKVGFDLQYIRDWSLFADIKIILKTFLVVVTGRGAC
jgi:lipopolysaccharide/colanic/teichoic acid biosynthesis glycosyltransferase